MAVKWGLEGELVCKLDQVSPAQPPLPAYLGSAPSRRHLPPACSPQHRHSGSCRPCSHTARSPLDIPPFHTHPHLGEVGKGHSADCPEFPHSTPDCISLPPRLNVASLLPLPLPPSSPHWHKTHLGTWSPPAGSHGCIFCSGLALLPYNPGRPLHNLERAEGRGGEAEVISGS